MEQDWDDLFTVDQIMGGLPARRASTLLFAIEGRTAYLVARSRRAMSRDYSGRSAEQAEQAFLSAMAEGASLPFEPSIQDLERYASEWVSLVPDDPSARAALARLIGEKYRVPAAWTPKLQRALGLDDPATASRFLELHGEPVSSIFVTDLTSRERLRWMRARMAARLEAMPPFWLAFSLTLTETAGGGALALPIAFAELGVTGAVIVLLVLGIVNALTIAALAESVSRNGDIRYGRAYFGRVVEDFLGTGGAMFLTLMLLVVLVVALLSYVIGISTTLAHAVGWSPMVWTIALLALLLYFLFKGSVESTVASSLAIGMCTIGSLVILSLLAVPHLDAGNLRHSEIPFVNGNALDAGVLELIFGVVLMALTGHTATASAAAVVLPRDSSARSLILGSAAAIACATLLYMLWVVGVNGAVDPAILASETGTALEPFSDVAGPAVIVIGTIFVLLAMGMAAIHISLGLSHLVQEWVPVKSARPGHPSSHTPAMILIGMTPTLLVILIVELLFASDNESFSKPLGLVGIVTIPLIAGVFPMLMLYASRRKGDRVPGYLWSFLGSRVAVIAISLFFLAGVVLHGLVIWTDPALRVLALAVAAGMLFFMVYAARTAFFPRGTLEILYDDHHGVSSPEVSLVAAGQNVAPIQVQETTGKVVPIRDEGTRPSLEICVPTVPVSSLRIWLHELVTDGISIPVGATVHPDGQEPFQIASSTGRITIPVTEEPRRLVIQPLHDAH